MIEILGEDGFINYEYTKLFLDCYDTVGNVIAERSVVSGPYMYELPNREMVPLRGTVKSVDYCGVDIITTKYQLLRDVMAGALRVESKREPAPQTSVWRVLNEEGVGPYQAKNRNEIEITIRASNEVVWGKIFDCDDIISNANGFHHPDPTKDESIGIGVLGWKENTPISRYHQYQNHQPQKEVLFGFLNEFQAKAWFSVEGLKALSKFGFRLQEVHAAKIVARSGHQCAFLP